MGRQGSRTRPIVIKTEDNRRTGLRTRRGRRKMTKATKVMGVRKTRRKERETEKC